MIGDQTWIDCLPLAQVSSNSFSVAVAPGGFVPIVAPSVPVSTITTLSTGGSTVSGYRLFFNARVAPSWLKVGVKVQFTGNSSAARGNVKLDHCAKVIAVAVDGTSCDLAVHVKNGTLTPLIADVLTNAPLVTLVVEAQKVIFSTPTTNTANVTITDGADVNGNASWSQDIPPGNTGYEVIAPHHTKINVASWFVKAVSAQTLMVRFL